MKTPGLLSWSIAVLLGPAEAPAETWQTTTGERIEGKLSGVYGPLVVLTGSTHRMLSIDSLDDGAIGRVADFLATRPAVPPTWGASSAPVAKSLRGRLQILRDNKLVAYDPGAKPEPEFFLAYFGAHWCGPCLQFSPDLVKAYARLLGRVPVAAHKHQFEPPGPLLLQAHIGLYQIRTEL